jgi:hypothetical protein
MERAINESMKFSIKKTINESMIRGRIATACGKTCGKVFTAPEVAEFKADNLVIKFNAPQCRKFFLKCVYHLSEAEIQNAIELATRPSIKVPVKYFNVVAKQMLTKHGY